jgi:uncharacterized protein
MKFEWNRAKAAANLRKHGVSFEEAATVFADVLSHVFPDVDHSDDETRFLLIGLSRSERVLVVFHTDRDDSVRVNHLRQSRRL